MIQKHFETEGNEDNNSEELSPLEFWLGEMSSCSVLALSSLYLLVGIAGSGILSPAFTDGILVCIMLKFGVKVGSGKPQCL
jgi:hypothetical protein